MQTLSPHSRQGAALAAVVEGQGKKHPLQEVEPALGGRGDGLKLQLRCLERKQRHAWRGDAARQKPGRRREDSSENPLLGMPGCGAGKEEGKRHTELRSGSLEEKGRRARKQEPVGKGSIAILRVSVQTNFRNFYFKTDSLLPPSHTNKHTLIHHVEILQTHLLKKN